MGDLALLWGQLPLVQRQRLLSLLSQLLACYLAASLRQEASHEPD